MASNWSKDWGPLAAQLAQMGLPTLGKAIGTIAGSSIPIVGGYLPGVGENLGREAARMIANALGVKPDPEAITAAIEGAPTTDVMATLQAKEAEAQHKWPALALMAKEETEQQRVAAEDTERARQFAIQLATMNSPVQWAPVILGSAIVIAFFGLMIVRTLSPPVVPDEGLSQLIGALAAAFGAVVGYYFGSSAGARRKDFTIQALSAAAAEQPKKPVIVPVPAPVTIKKTK